MSEELKAKDDEILELFKMCNEKDKEIEKLKEDISNYIKIVLHDRNEIERLNSIINKAIEYIELVVNCTPSSTRKDIANMILINHKTMLDILKGDDKE